MQVTSCTRLSFKQPFQMCHISKIYCLLLWRPPQTSIFITLVLKVPLLSMDHRENHSGSGDTKLYESWSDLSGNVLWWHPWLACEHSRWPFFNTGLRTLKFCLFKLWVNILLFAVVYCLSFDGQNIFIGWRRTLAQNWV